MPEIEERPPATRSLTDDVNGFLRREARLLDAGDLWAWLALFTPDGTYWIPAVPGQVDPKGVPSIIYEDVALLTMRLERLDHPRVHAARPRPRTIHLIGNVEIGQPRMLGDGAFTVSVDSSLIVVEYREPDKRLFAGPCSHLLKFDSDGWRIVHKRFELVDCDGVHDLISHPM